MKFSPVYSSSSSFVAICTFPIYLGAHWICTGKMLLETPISKQTRRTFYPCVIMCSFNWNGYTFIGQFKCSVVKGKMYFIHLGCVGKRITIDGHRASKRGRTWLLLLLFFGTFKMWKADFFGIWAIFITIGVFYWLWREPG